MAKGSGLGGFRGRRLREGVYRRTPLGDAVRTPLWSSALGNMRAMFNRVQKYPKGAVLEAAAGEVLGDAC